ncbi:MAG: hypothetical protein V3V31_04315 [Methylococcales bacterium]
MIEKSDSKWVSLATVSILGQPPSSSQKYTHLKRVFLSAKGIKEFRKCKASHKEISALMVPYCIFDIFTYG